MVRLGLNSNLYLKNYVYTHIHAHEYVPEFRHFSRLYAWVAGVQGISGEDCCIALCADENSGERGVAAIQARESLSRSDLHVLAW